MKYYLGIDIGGMSVKAGIITDDGKMVAKKTVETSAKGRTDDFIADMAKLAEEVTAEAGLCKSQISGVGMGVPGTVNTDTGVVTYACNIGFRNTPLAERFKELFGVSPKLANDADAAALGEVKFGAGNNANDALMITLGTGVGTGIIINGKIFSGRHGMGGESGHTVIVVDGELCGCGRRGCFEAYASATALIRQTEKAAEKYPDSEIAAIIARDGKVSGTTAFRAYKAGDAAGKEVVENYVKYIGEGTANLVNIFRPEIILVGGGVSNEGEYFIEMIENYVNANTYGRELNSEITVRKAALGNDAGIFGAAALCM